ncbi:MAG TPA: restriction endonuclease subunit S [Bacteroidales bacterium]|nr:restriction endonuclease subunit S [Bacteroidales bacterium]
MSETKKILPELRFPKFKDSGEWDVKKISDLGETISGLTGKSKDDFGAGKPFVTYKQVFDNSVINFEQCERVQINDDENQNSLQQGDILFTTSSETPNEVGFASVLIDFPKEKTYLNSFCFALRPFNIEKTQPQFSRYLFHSPIYRRSVTAIAQGSTRYNLSKGAFIEIQVPIPDPTEQQKIASCLSSLDEVIEAHSKKLELLKDHKKGLMQNLFPQEGEKVPKLRFKEFENSGEWEEKKLGEVSKFVRGPFGGALKKEIFVSSGFAVYEQSHAIYSNFKEFRYYINEDKFKELKRFAVNAGNLIMSCSGTMGKFAIIPKNFTEGVINQALLKLEIKKEFMVDFIKLTLELPENQEQILSQSGGGAIKNVASVNILKEIKIKIPSFAEQQKIASCLSSLDELIAAQEEKIEQLKLHKKGLMQGLFPKTITN